MANNSNNCKSRFNQILTWIIDNWLVILTLIAAIITGGLGLLGILEESNVLSAICGVLALLCGSILYDKQKQKKYQEGIMIFRKEVSKLSNSLSFLANGYVPDSFFRNLEEKEIIKNATEEIFLLQESGDKIFQMHRDFLSDFLHKGKKIKWIVVTSEDKEITKLMAFRNHDLIEFEGMRSRLKKSNTNFSDIKKSLGQFKNNLEVRFFTYPIDISGVFIDCNSTVECRKALIRLQSFKTRYSDKPCFELSENYSPKMYNFYKKQIETIWRHSSKCILLTGVSGVGKSTLLSKIVDRLEADNKNRNCINKIYLNGFITKDIKENGKRIGFETSSVEDKGLTKVIAKKKSENNYILEENAMNELILPILHLAKDKFSQNSLYNANSADKPNQFIKQKNLTNPSSSLLIIDEIGPIQLQSEGFKNVIDEILKINDISILGIIANTEDIEFIETIREHYRTRIIEIDEDNRDSLVDELYNELKLN